MSCTDLLPMPLRREGERLFDLSMWLLGRDVRHGDNLLLRRGFSRHGRAEGQDGTSAYSLALEGGGALTLWGFGALLRAWGAAHFIPRDGLVPRLVEESRVAWPVFQAAGLGSPREPVTPRERGAARAALAALADWLAEHEEWVGEVAGREYRRECVEARRKAPPVRVEALPAAWRRWASHVRALESAVNESSAPASGA
ncbi:hypothetical protein P2318_21405 [Myxococcaceae bacterium GXIMD 01537]